MLIRTYHPKDWPRLCEIHDWASLDELRRAIGEAAFFPLAQAATTEGLFDLRVDVAKINHRVEGFVAFSSDELVWLYVAPDAYRCGIGRALGKHAIAHTAPPVGSFPHTVMVEDVASFWVTYLLPEHREWTQMGKHNNR